MKCVKNVETGEVKRLSEEMATFRVNSGLWKFCPKKEWKETRVALPPVVESVVNENKETTVEIVKKSEKKKLKTYMKEIS